MCWWVIFALLELDPDCGSGYESRDPIESGSNPDRDLQHRLNLPTLLVA